MNDDDIRGLLRQEAARAPAPRFRAAALLGRARRRRRGLEITSGAAAIAVVVAAVFGIHGLTASNPRPAHSDGGPRRFVCGQTINAPFIDQTEQGVTLSIASVTMIDNNAAPQVAVKLTSPQVLTDFHVLQGPTPLRALLLRDGKIVAGADRPGIDYADIETDLGPGNPWVGQIGFQSGPCGDLTWKKIWDHWSDYQVVVVASDLQADVRELSDLDVPLLVAQTPLPAP